MPLRMLGLLMLMLLQCDADSSCPDGTLAVTSSEVIAEYGSTISLNCSKEDNDHYGMYWTIGKKNLKKEEDEAFVEVDLEVLDWNIRPQCNLALTTTFTCTKDLEITVYKNPDFIIVFPINHGISMVEGTQNQLQCNITDVAPVQNLMVKWYKDDEVIHEEHFTSTTKTPASVSHILTANISRKDNGAQFRCEAQLDFGPDGPKPPAISATHRVSVRYPPALNSEPIYLYKEEGANVTLNCDAEGNPTPDFHWVHNGVNMTDSTNSLFVNPVNEDSVYTCTAINDLGRKTKEFHVIKMTMTTPSKVEAMSEDSSPNDCPLTLIPAELVVKLGDPASVNCSTSVANPARLGWEAPKGGTGSASSTIITWTVEKVEFWNTSPMCYITTSDNDQCDMPLAMTVYNTPVIITQFPHGLVEEGKEALLHCDFINVAPVQNLRVKWYRGNEVVKTDMFDNASVQPVNVSSTLSVVHKRGDNGQNFSCRAELHLGPNGPNPVPIVTSEPYTADVYYKPQVKSCPNDYAGVEHNFSVDTLPCEADGNPQPKVQWFHQGKLVNLSQPLTRSHSGRYKVEFSNNLGKTSAYVDITIEYGPSFMCDDQYEVKENDTIQTSCKPVGDPVPSVAWFKDGQQVNQQLWSKHDSGKYILKASNKYGTATHEVEVDVMYAPKLEFTDSTSQVLAPGGNLTLYCSAEGKPAPQIRWDYPLAENVKEAKRGRHETVSITEATSVNVGVYICVATNEFGSASTTVILTMTDDTSGPQLMFPSWWWFLILVIIFVGLLLILLYRKHQKKHGQYSFVPDKSKEDIPMTTKSNGMRV